MDNSEDRELLQVLEDDLQANLEKPGGHRICRGCGKIKNLNRDDFYRDKKSALGFNRRCIDCKKLAQRKLFAARHPEAKPRPKPKPVPKKIEEERPKRIFPIRDDFDDSAHEQKAKALFHSKIHSIDKEICKLFSERRKQ